MADSIKNFEAAPGGGVRIGEGFVDTLLRLRQLPGGLEIIGGFAAAYALLGADRNTRVFGDTIDEFAEAARTTLTDDEVDRIETAATAARPLFTDALNARLAAKGVGDE